MTRPSSLVEVVAVGRPRFRAKRAGAEPMLTPRIPGPTSPTRQEQ